MRNPQDDIREYDDYPVPETIVPLTEKNKNEYLKICNEVDEIVGKILEEYG